jgi:hypothetical protein
MDNPSEFQQRTRFTFSKNHLMPMHKKPHLPEKTCPVCQRPFAWRKKWAKDWENVRYCSERCRRERNTQS